MTRPIALGDKVTVKPPFDDDEFVVSMRSHARVAEILPEEGPDSAVYMLYLDGAHPPDRKFGPFPRTRLLSGWDMGASHA